MIAACKGFTQAIAGGALTVVLLLRRVSLDSQPFLTVKKCRSECEIQSSLARYCEAKQLTSLPYFPTVSYCLEFRTS